MSPTSKGAIGMQVIRDVTIPCPCYGRISGGQTWPIRSIKSYICCLQHKSDLSKAPLHLIVATALMDLIHVEFTSIEMTLELNRPPKVPNVLVFQDHFTKHVMVYVTPNQAAKIVAKFLYQGYMSIFWAPARFLSNWGAKLHEQYHWWDV